jgi:hypothetical protein
LKNLYSSSEGRRTQPKYEMLFILFTTNPYFIALFDLFSMFLLAIFIKKHIFLETVNFFQKMIYSMSLITYEPNCEMALRGKYPRSGIDYKREPFK